MKPRYQQSADGKQTRNMNGNGDQIMHDRITNKCDEARILMESRIDKKRKKSIPRKGITGKTGMKIGCPAMWIIREPLVGNVDEMLMVRMEYDHSDQCKQNDGNVRALPRMPVHIRKEIVRLILEGNSIPNIHDRFTLQSNETLSDSLQGYVLTKRDISNIYQKMQKSYQIDADDFKSSMSMLFEPKTILPSSIPR